MTKDTSKTASPPDTHSTIEPCQFATVSQAHEGRTSLIVFYSFYHWEGSLQTLCVCLSAQNKVFWSHARKGTVWPFFSEMWHVVLLLITVSLLSLYYLCQMFICWGIFHLYFTFPYCLKLVDWPEMKNAQSLNDSSSHHSYTFYP